MTNEQHYRSIELKDLMKKVNSKINSLNKATSIIFYNSGGDNASYKIQSVPEETAQNISFENEICKMYLHKEEMKLRQYKLEFENL